MSMPRLVYMGTPGFAVPALEVLAARIDIELVLVVTQPDRPAGRGRRLASPPVKVAAQKLNLPLLQTHTLRDSAIRERITALCPDLIVVAAFGLILGRWILELPAAGCVNLHASLLPNYRGANPIATAILHGDPVTGVSLMRMESGLDTGPVFATRSLDILTADTTETLRPRLADLAADLLAGKIASLLDGSLLPVPQQEPATLTRPLVKADGLLDWTRSAIDLDRRIRAMWPWPRAFTFIPDEASTVLQIHAAIIAASDDSPQSAESSEPGLILPNTTGHHGVLVETGTGTRLLMTTVQFPGGRPLEGVSLTGHRALRPGTILGRRVPG